MRNLLKIILAGLIAFMALAITQQWGYFSSAWFGEVAEPPELSDEDVASATDTVREILVLLEHFYGTGGDPRFAERIPVSPQILQELDADIQYLRHNRRRQEPRLQRLEVVDVSPAGADRVTITTKEYWIHRIFWLDEDGDEAEKPHSQVITGTYYMRKQTQGWWLERWAISPGSLPSKAESGS